MLEEQRRWRACVGKEGFPSRKNAAGFAIKAALREMEYARTPEERKRADRMQAYRCPWCRRWHIGHSGGRSAGRKRRRKEAV